MSEDYEFSRVDWDFDVTTRIGPKGRRYSPEYPRGTEQERPVCRRSDRCEGCPYPGHGFVCWSENGDCMRSRIAKINRIEKEEQDFASDHL